MASSANVPPVSLMAELRACGVEVPILFPITAVGFAVVSAFELSLRFSLDESSMWVEREIYDPSTSLLSVTMRENSRIGDTGLVVWELTAGKYRVYGLPQSQISRPTRSATPRQSSTCAIHTTPTTTVKIEPGVHVAIDLSDSDNDKATTPQSPSVRASPSSHTSPILTYSSPSHVSLAPRPSSSTSQYSIVQSLRVLSAMPGRKSILKKLDYSTLLIEEVSYLPPRFDGTRMFVLPPPSASASTTKAKSMDGMDKYYDGHVWTKTQTTNISNSEGLTFRSSACVGHLQCCNKNCDFLQRVHRTSKFNDIEFDGFTKESFSVGNPPPVGSTLVCRICKEPPVCIARCEAKIYYVHSDASRQRACIHIGQHQHPVKVGDCRASRHRIEALIEEHVENTPQATHSKIVLEASKDLIGEYLLQNDDKPHHPLSLAELEPVFNRCKDLNSPHLRRKVTGFKQLRRLGVIDGIAKLRGVSNWAFVQSNRFPGQGDEADKVFVFKMSEVGPGSGVDLVRRMQPSGDLEHAWMMFDHVKRVSKWTTMACHVYDGTFQRILTIACCDFQSEDKDAQVLFWQNLNNVMGRHGIPLPYFKGFMADSAQANWNAVRIVYGTGDPKVPLQGRERTCAFHWSQSLEKHTRLYISHDKQDQHRHLCLQYKNASSMLEAETRYATIKAWWSSSKCTNDDGLTHLNLWLAFWHFRYRQWGGFMELVGTFASILYVSLYHMYFSIMQIVLTYSFYRRKSCRRRNLPKCPTAILPNQFITSGSKLLATREATCTWRQ